MIDDLEELRKSQTAMAHYTGVELAGVISSLMALAALWDKDGTKQALKSVFDLSAVEEYVKRIMLVVTDAQRMASEALDRIRDFAKDLDGLERRIDGLTEKLERAEKYTGDVDF